MEGLTFDDLGQPAPASVVVLHNNMINALRKAYPVWADHWSISINTDGGIVQVRNRLIGGKMGFQIRITNIDVDHANVVRMAGELFERYNIARNKGLDIRQAMADLKKAPIGDPIHEV